MASAAENVIHSDREASGCCVMCLLVGDGSKARALPTALAASAKGGERFLSEAGTAAGPRDWAGIRGWVGTSRWQLGTLSPPNEWLAASFCLSQWPTAPMRRRRRRGRLLLRAGKPAARARSSGGEIAGKSETAQAELAAEASGGAGGAGVRALEREGGLVGNSMTWDEKTPH